MNNKNSCGDCWTKWKEWGGTGGSSNEQYYNHCYAPLGSGEYWEAVWESAWR